MLTIPVPNVWTSITPDEQTGASTDMSVIRHATNGMQRLASCNTAITCAKSLSRNEWMASPRARIE